MRILYVTQMMTKSFIEESFKKNGKDPGFAGQKLNRLLVDGLRVNGVEVDVLCRSPLPIGNFCFGKKEKEDGINYQILPYIRQPFIYHVVQVLYTFIYVTHWSIRNRDAVVLSDALCKSLVYGSVFSSFFTRKKIVGIVTDMPGMSYQTPNGYKINTIGAKMHYFLMSKYSGFIYISELSDRLLNPRHKPYIIMEGLVDRNYSIDDVVIKRETIDFMYAGALNSVYGLDMLVNAFMKLDSKDVRLIIYGDGPYKSELIKHAEIDNRIEYRGLALNSEVLEVERSSSFLVNPRPTKDEYTFYSFPSKNIEYMLSGTPVITTKLVSMPDDYLDKVIIFKDESEEGYYLTMQDCIVQDKTPINEMAKAAQLFIMNTRNNISQTKRIIDFFNFL